MDIAKIDEFGLLLLNFSERMFDETLGFNLSMINNETLKLKLVDFDSLQV